MSTPYDVQKLNAFLDRLQYEPSWGEILLPQAPQHYADKFSFRLEGDLVSIFYDGHYHFPQPLIQTNDQDLSLLALYVFLRREEAFFSFPGSSSPEERERRLRACRRVSFGGTQPGKYFALCGGDAENAWSVGYRDGERAVTFFSGLSRETALFYLEGFVQAEPAFDALFAQLQRETGIEPSERTLLLTVYLCGCCGAQIYEEKETRREYPPEGAGRFDFARVDSFLYHRHRLRLNAGPIGEYCTYVEQRPDGSCLLAHQFDEKQNPERVVVDEDPVRVLLAAKFFDRFDGCGGQFLPVDEQELRALRQDPRVSYLRRQPDKFYLLQEEEFFLLGLLHGDEDLRLASFCSSYGIRELERQLVRYLRLYASFSSQFRMLCRPGLLEERDWSLMFRAAREGYFA